MNITTCPKCKMRVLPKSDGTCPSCGAVIRQKAFTPRLPKEDRAKKSVTRVPNGYPEENARGANRPQKIASLEETYRDYLQEAEDITRWAGVNIILPFLLLSVIVILTKPLAISYIAPKMAWTEVDRKYNPYTEFLASQGFGA
ncbi:MAG: hypothetical protein HXY38_16090 [Chloroflexi bacterium]|nr:hypothetical protein [Chloroflexota bacterium]